MLSLLAWFYDLNLFAEKIWLLPIVFVLLIGWVNAFNFMDGISITILYALTAIISFALLPLHQDSLLLITMDCLVFFGVFNVRKKAKHLLEM
jgi:UDP-N-acetylmuramyl pentapeptide phosphotransferase/UDP-N-acetylglucosamine-1-phosphate transferase